MQWCLYMFLFISTLFYLSHPLSLHLFPPRSNTFGHICIVLIRVWYWFLVMYFWFCIFDFWFSFIFGRVFLAIHFLVLCFCLISLSLSLPLLFRPRCFRQPCMGSQTARFFRQPAFSDSPLFPTAAPCSGISESLNDEICCHETTCCGKETPVPRRLVKKGDSCEKEHSWTKLGDSCGYFSHFRHHKGVTLMRCCALSPFICLYLSLSLM